MEKQVRNPPNHASVGFEYFSKFCKDSLLVMNFYLPNCCELQGQLIKTGRRNNIMNGPTLVTI